MPRSHTLSPLTALLQSSSPPPLSHLLPPGATVIDTSIVAMEKSTNTNGAGQTSQTQRVYSSTANGCATKRNQLSLHDCQTILVHGLCDVKGGRCERTCSGCDDTTTSTAIPLTSTTRAVTTAVKSTSTIETTNSIPRVSYPYPHLYL